MASFNAPKGDSGFLTTKPPATRKPATKRFNAPKGDSGFLTDNFIGYFGSRGKEFQCPEGRFRVLNYPQHEVIVIEGPKFQCPEGRFRVLNCKPWGYYTTFLSSTPQLWQKSLLRASRCVEKSPRSSQFPPGSPPYIGVNRIHRPYIWGVIKAFLRASLQHAYPPQMLAIPGVLPGQTTMISFSATTSVLPIISIFPRHAPHIE